MSEQIQIAAAPNSVEPIISAPVPAPKTPSRLKKIIFAPIKLFFGMLFCQSILGAFLVIGWTFRLMQRRVLKSWWKKSKARDTQSFAEFLALDSRTVEHLHWPNWFAAQNFSTLEPRLFTRLKSLFVSFRANLKTGVQGIFNIWLFTVPASVLWLFGWHYGWDNSFNKGYEQSWVGPVIAWLGIFLFIAAMFYVPMAQARQAATGNWKNFYQFAFIWKLIRRKWLANLGLAICYSLASLPVMWLSAVPSFFPNINPKLSQFTPAQTIDFLNTFYFWAALAFFPAFVFLRIISAKIYASAILKSVQSGAISQESLAENEWQALHRLGLLEIQAVAPKPVLWRIVAWAGTRAGRITAGFLTALVWFSFVAQIYIREFLNYHVGFGWLNQPLVQLPWFHYIPAHLKNPLGEIFATGFFIAVLWFGASVWKRIRALRNKSATRE